MIKAGIAGLGWWGKTLVESVQDQSDDIRFVAGTTRTLSPETREFAKAQGFELRPSYDKLISDPGIDAVVLATPPLDAYASGRRGIGCRQACIL
ncbi:MAG: Gfo/Idh/MocA family oxidoreductase [Candidatus Binatia bacterium]